MKLSLRRVFLLILFLFVLSFDGMGQRPCPPGQAPCGAGNTCKLLIECRGGPPPPGLVVPIDSHISILIISGMGLGIYFLVSNRKKKAA